MDGAGSWIAEASAERSDLNPESLEGGWVRMVLVEQDPDAVSGRKVAAGATEVWHISDQPDG